MALVFTPREKEMVGSLYRTLGPIFAWAYYRQRHPDESSYDEFVHEVRHLFPLSVQERLAQTRNAL